MYFPMVQKAEKTHAFVKIQLKNSNQIIKMQVFIIINKVSECVSVQQAKHTEQNSKDVNSCVFECVLFEG